MTTALWHAACRWYDLVLAAEDDIATIMTVESGKPLKESKGEFTSGCALLQPHLQIRLHAALHSLRRTWALISSSFGTLWCQKKQA